MGEDIHNAAIVLFTDLAISILPLILQHKGVDVSNVQMIQSNLLMVACGLLALSYTLKLSDDLVIMSKKAT